MERAFRSLKLSDLQVRLILHRLEHRVRAHFFICMLADLVEWHMRKAWLPCATPKPNPTRPGIRCCPPGVRRRHRPRFTPTRCRTAAVPTAFVPFSTAVNHCPIHPRGSTPGRREGGGRDRGDDLARRQPGEGAETAERDREDVARRPNAGGAGHLLRAYPLTEQDYSDQPPRTSA